jgi:hypothetical protein
MDKRKLWNEYKPVVVILPLTFERANKSILLDHTMSSTVVATCRSSNCRIAFDDVIVYYLLQRGDLNNKYYRQTTIKNWRLHSPTQF